MREEIEAGHQRAALALAFLSMKARLKQKGSGAFVSSHEILGIVTEEFHELVRAVEADDVDALAAELLDVATACLLGIASIHADGLEWPRKE